MISGFVKDFFSKGFVSVHEDDTLSRCISLFKKGKPALVVIDSQGKYKGVLAPRWIIRSRLDPTTTKAKTLMRSAPKTELDDSLSKVARLMIQSEIKKLPVYSEGKLLGFVTDEDVIYGVVMQEWGNTKAEEIMTKRPFVVEEDESLGSVLSLFREKGFSHAPVVSNGSLVGIISIHDIIEHVFKPQQRQTFGEMVGEKIRSLSVPVRAIMSKPVITVLPENKLRYVTEKMRKFDISSLIVTSNGRPVGIVTKRDFLEPIAQMETMDRELALQFSIRDVEIDEIQRNVIIDDFKSFTRKYRETLEAGTLFLYMKTHGTNYKGGQLIHCRLQLRTRRGSFFSSNEGWDVGQTFRRALDRLEKQILRSKEFERNPQFSKMYLERIEFPFTEL